MNSNPVGLYSFQSISQIYNKLPNSSGLFLSSHHNLPSYRLCKGSPCKSSVYNFLLFPDKWIHIEKLIKMTACDWIPKLNVRSYYFGDREFAQAEETRKVEMKFFLCHWNITHFYIMISTVTTGHSVSSQKEKLLTVLMMWTAF